MVRVNGITCSIIKRNLEMNQYNPLTEIMFTQDFIYKYRPTYCYMNEDILLEMQKIYNYLSFM